MPNVSSTLPNLINGVSQQPPHIRLPSQGQAQLNALSSEVDGLKKRPPSVWLANLWDRADQPTPNTADGAENSPCVIVTHKTGGVAPGTLGITTTFTMVKQADGPDGEYVFTYPPGFSNIVVGANVSVTLRVFPGGINDDDPGRFDYQVEYDSGKSATSGVAYFEDSEATDDGLGALTKQTSTAPPYANTFTIDDWCAQDDLFNDDPKFRSGGFGTAERPFTHLTSRDIDERYLIAIRDGDLRVFDILTGTEQTIDYPNGKDYLDLPAAAGLDPQAEANFEAVTIADTTILVNRTVIPAMSTDLTATENFKMFAWVERGDYSTSYNLKIEDTSYTHETPESVDGDASDALDTTTITFALYTALTHVTTGLNGAAVDGYSNWNVAYENSALTIYRDDGAEFKVEFFDDRGNQNMSVFTTETERVSDLPLIAPHDKTIRITGIADEDVDDYYVKFQANDPTLELGKGKWVETTAEGIEFSPDRTTMPHVIERLSDGTFLFRQGDWKERVAGDIDSAPTPSFFGKAIRDIFFYKNRLGLLADESIILSTAGEFFNFFPATVQQLEDDQPIDVDVTHSNVSVLESAVTLGDDLILFSDQHQFRLTGEPLLTPTTVSVTPATSYESNLYARPIEIGNKVYFTTRLGANFSGMMELLVSSDGETLTANELTSHVPRYITGSVTQMEGSSNENLVLLLTPDDRKKLFVYKFYEGASDGQKIQSSWSEWGFTCDAIISAHFIDSILYVVLKKDESITIEKMDFSVDLTSSILHMDGLHQEDTSGVTVTFDNPTTSFEFVHEFVDDGTEEYIAYDPATETVYDLTVSSEDTAFTVDNVDLSAVSPLWLGSKYNFQYQFSTLYPIERLPTGGQIGIVDGRTQIHRMKLNYANARDFVVTVTPQDRTAYTYTFDEAAIATGVFQFPILTQNTQATIVINDDSVNPLSFQSAVWEGRYYTHTRRM